MATSSVTASDKPSYDNLDQGDDVAIMAAPGNSKMFTHPWGGDDDLCLDTGTGGVIRGVTGLHDVGQSGWDSGSIMNWGDSYGCDAHAGDQNWVLLAFHDSARTYNLTQFDDRFDPPNGIVQGWVPRINICKLSDVNSGECNCNTSVDGPGGGQSINDWHEFILQ